MKFSTFYSSNRFRYIHKNLECHDSFDCNDRELIPKTACLFAKELDVYIDTSDGVNDDLGIQEYCGRMLRCIQMSAGKKFLFFKAAHSSVWSKNLESLAEDNNGKVIPFFKWSFNDNFYRYTLSNIGSMRQESQKAKINYDLGLFADFSKKYMYPKPSSIDKRISWSDHKKFNIEGVSPDMGYFTIDARTSVLNRLKKGKYNIFSGALPYKDYLITSMTCNAIVNPPGIGEYTSRMFDQTAIGNLIILRKNSYDQGHSWKEYIPEVDFRSDEWREEMDLVLNDRDLWIEKSKYYFDNYWSSEAIFSFLIEKIQEAL